MFLIHYIFNIVMSPHHIILYIRQRSNYYYYYFLLKSLLLFFYRYYYYYYYYYSYCMIPTIEEREVGEQASHIVELPRHKEMDRRWKR